MIGYILHRLFLAVIVLLLVSIIAFMLVKLIPGDPVLAMVELEDLSMEQVEKLRQDLGLDRPLIEQYGYWLSKAIRGDFGKSIFFREPVIDLISKRLPVTALLSFLSLVVAVLVSIPAGVISAIRRGGLLDSIITVSANTGIATPIFWMGILGIYLFGLKLEWLPIQGYTSPFENLSLSVKQMVMPIFCLAVVPLASITRQTRSSMLEVIHQDYIRTAWAKGLKERTIIIRHALKNGLLPSVTLLGVHVRHLVAGAVLVESVFNLPGMGRLLVRAVFDMDFVTVQACVLMIGFIVVITNLIVDISYGWLDPRIRYD